MREEQEKRAEENAHLEISVAEQHPCTAGHGRPSSGVDLAVGGFLDCLTAPINPSLPALPLPARGVLYCGFQSCSVTPPSPPPPTTTPTEGWFWRNKRQVLVIIPARSLRNKIGRLVSVEDRSRRPFHRGENGKLDFCSKRLSGSYPS